MDPQQDESALLNLPTDALLALLGCLGPQDLLRLGCCCRLLCRIARSNCLWMSLCKRWQNLVDLPTWRSSFDSALALFRCLLFFDHFAGIWTAKGHRPRGSLLYITWGSSCLVGCNVLGCMTGKLKLARLFEIVGLQDGSFKVELFSKDTKNIGRRFPGQLVWDPKDKTEFTLAATEHNESIGQAVSNNGLLEPDVSSVLMQLVRSYQAERGEGHIGQQHPPAQMGLPEDRTVMEEQNRAPEQVTLARRVNLLQRLLSRRLEHEEDQHDMQTTGGLNFSQRALQYILRLASPTRNNLVLEGQQNGDMNAETRHIVRCSYSKLKVGELSEKSDFAGLWCGTYGPHGAEVVNVTHSNEGIFGTKIIGDANVPCGQVTFRVSRPVGSVEVPVELQQIVDLQLRNDLEPFVITKSYPGHGRIAGHNFRNPLWVPGHLLVSRTGQIAFIWEDVNFVVSFEKLNLAMLYRSQEQLSMLS